MRIARVVHEGAPATGVVDGDELLVMRRLDGSTPWPWELAEAGLDDRRWRVVDRWRWPELEPLAIVDPSIVLCAEDNFATQKRSRKTGLAAMRPSAIEPFRRPDPAEDVWILPRDPASVTGPGNPILCPPGCTMLDAGIALAAVADSNGAVAGYCVALDVVRRDVPIEHAYLARSYRTHTPVGSVLYTPDELHDPATVTLASSVDGERRQSAQLADQVAGAPVLFESIGRRCRLAGGDLVLLGTPPGIANDRGHGWLTPANTIHGEVSGLGTITAVVEAEA